MSNEVEHARRNLNTFIHALGIELKPHQHALVQLIECTQIAGEEIQHVARRYSRGRGAPVAKRVREAFLALRPTPVLQSFLGGPLYRLHVRELLARVVAQEALEPGTLAECLAAMSTMSLKAPPGQDFAAAMHQVFKELLPNEWLHLGFDKEPEPRAYTPDGVVDILRDLRRKLSTNRGS